MKAMAGSRQNHVAHFYVIIHCTLVGQDGREKAVVFHNGSEQTILSERQRRLKVGRL